MKYTIQEDTDRFNTPIYYKGENGSSVLLLHGFTSTPVVFEELAQELNRAGYTVFAPILAGHGTTPEDLETTGWKDWFLSAQEGYERLEIESDNIFVLGFSIGCNLSCLIAAEHKIAGLILIGFPRWLQHQTAAKLLTYHHQIRKIRFFEKKNKFEENDTMFTTDTAAYRKIPTKVMSHIFLLMSKITDRSLVQIQAPVLIMQSANDGLIAARSAHHAMKLIPSTHKQLIWVDEPHNRLHLGKSKHQILSYIMSFLERWHEEQEGTRKAK